MTTYTFVFFNTYITKFKITSQIQLDRTYNLNQLNHLLSESVGEIFLLRLKHF